MKIEKPKKAYIYARYSSSKQNDATIDLQLDMCRGYAERNNMVIVDEFIDRAKSAKNIYREDLQNMIDKATSKKDTVDYVLVYKIDRFSRDVQGALFLIEKLGKNGVRIKSVTENFSDDPSGDLVRNMLLAVAEYDNKVRAMRVKDSMKDKYLKGFWLWNYPLGYTRNEIRKISSTGRKAGVTKPLEIIPAYKKPLVALFNEAAKGKLRQTALAKLINQKYQFAKIHGKPLTSKMVDKIISKKFYFGIMESDTFGEVKGNHTSIIDEITWRKANIELGLNWGKSKKQDTSELTFTDFYFCSYCGRELESYIKNKILKSGDEKTYCYYACRGRQG